MRLRNLGTVFVAAAVSACADSPTASPPLMAPVASVDAVVEQAIPGRFIVTLRSGENAPAVAAAHGVRPDFVYANVFNGFAGSMSDAARSGLLRDARVVRVEQDGVAHTTTTQTSATWGLDRIDQRALPLSTTYTYANTGAGVTAYIIDTGIQFNHPQFSGRAFSGYDAVDGGQADDCNGHGTHVSGTVGGSTYGVAKGVTLIGVRVLDCGGSGSWSGVIAGMDWVAGNHQSGAPAVANMSLGGGANASVDNALRAMIADGVATAVAAGNGNMGGVAQDACKYSPARVAEAMTVGATSSTDAKTSWSNYGNCVDWFAPGLNITSSWIGSTTKTISGTSMATPHTTGVAALYLQGNSSATPQQVRDALYANTSKGVVTSSKTANNHLLYTNY